MERTLEGRVGVKTERVQRLPTMHRTPRADMTSIVDMARCRVRATADQVCPQSGHTADRLTNWFTGKVHDFLQKEFAGSKYFDALRSDAYEGGDKTQQYLGQLKTEVLGMAACFGAALKRGDRPYL